MLGGKSARMLVRQRGWYFFFPPRVLSGFMGRDGILAV